MTKRIVSLLAMLAILMLPFSSGSAQNADQSVDKSLKIFSWNIYMLPASASMSKQIGKISRRKRAKGIAEYIAEQDFDIIVWQEIFNRAARRKIKRKLRKLYPYQYGPANQSLLSFKVSSGLSFFSKVPLTNKETVKFKDCLGSDCWARKGALSMQGEWEGQPFQIVGTHLQAAGGSKLRLDQAQEIADQLLDPNQKEGVPQIICGDMNIAQKWPEYKDLIDIYKVAGYSYADSVNATNTGSEPYIIDYIFVRDNGAQIADIERSMVIPRKQWASDQDWLSDHHAIFMKILFQN